MPDPIVQPGVDVAQNLGITQAFPTEDPGGSFNTDIQPPLVGGDVPEVDDIDVTQEVLDAEQELLEIQQRESALAEAEHLGAVYTAAAATHMPPEMAEFVIDKIGRLTGGVASIIGGVDDAVYGGMTTLSNLFLDDKIDTHEERSAMIEYLQNAAPILNAVPGVGAVLGLAGAAEGIEDYLKGVSEPLTTRVEERRDDEGRVIRKGESAYEDYGDDFTVAFEEGDLGAGADLLIGDVVEALPSVAAAFAGPGGLALIGASAFGNKYTDEFNSAVDEGRPVDTNRIFGQAFVTAGGEVLTEAFTAGLGKGIVSMASKLGPKVATTVARNAMAKIGFGIVGEGFSEGSAGVIEDAADYLIGKDEKAFEGGVRRFIKNGIVGGIIGGGIATSQLNDNSVARQIVENAIKPHAIQESQKTAAAKINALYMDLKTAKDQGDDLLADAIQDDINYYENAIHKSQKKYSEQTDNLSPQQVKELSDIKTELDSYLEIQNSPDFELYDNAARDVIRNKVQKLKDKQAEIFTQPALTEAKAQKTNVKSVNKIAKDINQTYLKDVEVKDPETGKITYKKPSRETIDAVIEKGKGNIFNYARKRFYEIPKNLRRGSLDEFVSELSYGKRGVENIIKGFDPSKNDNLSAYVNKFIDNRALEIKDQFTAKTDLTVDDLKGGGVAGDIAPVYTEAEKTTAQTVADLNLPVESLRKADHAAELFDTKISLGEIQSPKQYMKSQQDFFKGALLKDVKKLLRPKGSQIEKQKVYRGFIRSKAPALQELVMNSPGISQVRQGKLAEWRDFPPSNREFADYFTGADLDLTTHKGRNALNRRKESLEDKLADGLGQKAWSEYLDRSPEARQRVAEITEIKAHAIAEKQGDVDWDSRFVSEVVSDSDSDFATLEKNYQKIIENGGGKPDIPNLKTEAGQKRMQDWVADNLVGLFPRSFFKGDMWANSSRGFTWSNTTKMNKYFDENGTQFADDNVGGVNWSNVGRVNYGQGIRNALKKNPNMPSSEIVQMLKDQYAKNKDKFAENTKAYNYMMKQFENLIQKDPDNANFIAAFYMQASNSQAHINRYAAPLVAYSTKFEADAHGKRLEEEHAVPQNRIARYALTKMMKGEIDQAIPHINRNFVQVALSKKDDGKLYNPKEGYNYRAAMPDGWNIEADNTWGRYWNPDVNSNDGGIDPNSIVSFKTGKSIADTYLPGVELDPVNFHGETQSLTPAQQESVKALEEARDNSTSEYGKELVQRAIDNLILKATQRNALAAEFTNPVNNKLDQMINDLKGKVHPAAISNLEAINGVADIISNSWPGEVKVVTTIEDVQNELAAAGIGRKHPSYFNNLYGMTFPNVKGQPYNVVFVNPHKTTIETAIHEMGHIWSSRVKENNSKLWYAMTDMLSQSKEYHNAVRRITSNTKAYPKHKFNFDSDGNPSDGMRDEILADLIGKKGKELFENQQQAKRWDDYIRDFWNTVKDVLGFNPATKNFEDLTVDEMLEIATQEILEGNVGGTLGKLKNVNKGTWYNKNKLKLTTPQLHAEQNPSPELQAARDIRKEYRANGGNLDAAIQKVAKSSPLGVDAVMEMAGRIKEIEVGDSNAKKQLAFLKKPENQDPNPGTNPVQPRSKSLAAFDFDDTLFSSDSKVVVKKKDGSTFELTPEQFGQYVKKPGEVFDFAQFDQVIKPEALPALQEMKDALDRGDDVTIVTARTPKAGTAVAETLNKFLGPKAKKVKYIGLQSSSPQAKANYISRAVNKYGYDNVYFTDDILGNVEAVKEALEQIPNVNNRTKLAEHAGIPVDLSTATDKIVAGKKRSKIAKFLNKYLISPEAEDIKGLLYALGKTDSDVEFLSKNIIDTYQAGVMAFKADRLKAQQGINTAIKGLGYSIKDKLMGNKLQADNAAALKLIKKGGDADTRIQQFVNDLSRIDGGQFLEFIKENDSVDPIGAQFFSYMNTKSRKKHLEQFINNYKEMFYDGKRIKESITKEHGKSFATSLDNILKRMERGTNRPLGEVDSETSKVLDFINKSNAVIMFLNTRSAALQMLSSFNYLRPAISQGGTSAFKNYRANLKELWDSDYLRDRRGKAAFDVSADDLMDQGGGSWLSKTATEFGFLPTKVADAFAIASGGAMYYGAMLKKHNGDKAKAMDDFIKFTEENQQSSDPARIGKAQASAMGRVIFAFLNTPFQYTRLTKRAIQDIANGRGNTGDNLAKIAYYGAAQSAAFAMLQQAISFADLFSEDEEDEQKIEWAFDSWLSSTLKTFGLPGAAASVLYSTGMEYKAQAEGGSRVDPEKLALKAIEVSPPISRKIRDIINVGKSLYRQNRKEIMEEGIKSKKLWETVADAGDVFNLQTSRMFDKVNNLYDAVYRPDLTEWHRFLKTLGYSDYALGTQQTKSDDPFSSAFGGSAFDSAFDSDSPFDRLAKGEAGQAHRDGTIELDPNLSEEERALTIAHEKQHIEDMKTHGLDYDDNNIYWKGDSYKRKDGKIEYNGKMYIEGHPDLPWEKRAYKAEEPLKRMFEESPINRPHKGHKHDHKEHEAGEGDRGSAKAGTPEWDQAVQEGIKFQKDWYSNPKTKELLFQQAPGYDEARLQKKLDRFDKVKFIEGPASGAVAEYYRQGDDHTVEVNPAYGVDRPGLVAHELSHAASWDYHLGKEAQKHLGKPKFGSYLTSPDEVYGNLQELRSILNLNPSERDLTPGKIKKLMEERGDDNAQEFIDAFGIDKVTKALNKVAYQEKKQKDKSALARLKQRYGK